MSFNRFISNVICITGLLLMSSNTYALHMLGELQPQRYTYYLTSEYAQKLNLLRQQEGYATYPQSKLGLSRTIGQKNLAEKPQPKAMTCISSIWYNDLSKQQQLNIGCIDDTGMEYQSAHQWPDSSIATRVCQFGEAGCEAFLVMDSDKWNGPK